jgi:signal transduction histidine kinase
MSNVFSSSSFISLQGGEIAFVAALAFLYVIGQRLQQWAAARRQRDLLAERLRERARIARELHDTLLQTVQGMLMLVEAGTRDLPCESPARANLENGLRAVRASLQDARLRICTLRCPAGNDRDLTDALRLTRAEYPDSKATLHVLSIGKPYPLSARVQEELAAIGRESIRNAFSHSGATKIIVELAYKTQTFAMRITDDGEGIADSLSNGDSLMSWGICGMHERARELGARLYIRSQSSGGTVVGLNIARKHACPGQS